VHASVREATAPSSAPTDTIRYHPTAHQAESRWNRHILRLGHPVSVADHAVREADSDPKVAGPWVTQEAIECRKLMLLARVASCLAYAGQAAHPGAVSRRAPRDTRAILTRGWVRVQWHLLPRRFRVGVGRLGRRRLALARTRRARRHTCGAAWSCTAPRHWLRSEMTTD
jgi:hypothetical protein